MGRTSRGPLGHSRNGGLRGGISLRRGIPGKEGPWAGRLETQEGGGVETRTK